MKQSTEQLTVFGRVVEGFMEERGVEDVRGLVDRAAALDLALDGHAIRGRMLSTGYPLGYLNELADVLELDLDERHRLAMAYTFELEVPHE